MTFSTPTPILCSYIKSTNLRPFIRTIDTVVLYETASTASLVKSDVVIKMPFLAPLTAMHR